MTNPKPKPLLILIFIIMLVESSCKNNNTIFQEIESSKSGIEFRNDIPQNDSINVIDLENVFNGGGEAAGDFNNDGLQDLYFTGNVVSNKLYLNQGNLKFKDITSEAGVDGKARWSRGVATVDINNDGLLDIYVCATLKKRAAERANLLYINKGMNKDGIPVFSEMAAEYGIADTSQSTMAAFFDFMASIVEMENDGT